MDCTVNFSSGGPGGIELRTEGIVYTCKQSTTQIKRDSRRSSTPVTNQDLAPAHLRPWHWLVPLALSTAAWAATFHHGACTFKYQTWARASVATLSPSTMSPVKTPTSPLSCKLFITVPSVYFGVLTPPQGLSCSRAESGTGAKRPSRSVSVEKRQSYPPNSRSPHLPDFHMNSWKPLSPT